MALYQACESLYDSFDFLWTKANAYTMGRRKTTLAFFDRRAGPPPIPLPQSQIPMSVKRRRGYEDYTSNFSETRGDTLSQALTVGSLSSINPILRPNVSSMELFPTLFFKALLAIAKPNSTFPSQPILLKHTTEGAPLLPMTHSCGEQVDNILEE